MIPLAGQPVLTAAAMRAAEARAVAAGTSLAALMERAGAAVAQQVRRLAVGAEVLVLCGPGNNGGDGWVAAATLAAAGHPVRVAALAEPATDLARVARARWIGPVEPFADASPAPVLVDALFGVGLARPLEPAVQEKLADLLHAARLSIAIDLPSGLMSDTGDAPHGAAQVDLTLALGAAKPAHVLFPAAGHCGTVRLLDIGLGLDETPVPQVGPDWTIARPSVPRPGFWDHKYTRGLVLVIGGAMPGASALAAEAAMHAGAGYTMLFADEVGGGAPHALVRRRWSPDALAHTLGGKRPDDTALVIGPGLGRDDEARGKLAEALKSDCHLVIDGDALHLLDDAAFARFHTRPAYCPAVLTPHAGEFKALFGKPDGNKLDQARAAAVRSGAVVVYKGPDTVVAYPDGRTRATAAAHPWLSTAGTGDVLAGTVGAMLCATSIAPTEAAVWMHGEAARRLGGAFTADQLAGALAPVRAAL